MFVAIHQIGHWDPVFNESITLQLSGKERVLHIVRYTAYCCVDDCMLMIVRVIKQLLSDESIGANKVIGRCDIDFKLLKNGETQRFWVYDPDNIGENTYPSRGEIEIQSFFAMGEGRTPDARQPNLALPVQEGTSRPVGQLKLDGKQARQPVLLVWLI
jgi:hypothetical protein